MNTSNMHIGLVGIGNLGAAMAEALLRDGWSLTVFDLDGARVRELVSQGAAGADSLDGLASCAVVGVVVPGEAEARDVIAGPRGLIHSLEEQATIVLHSTLPPDAVKSLDATVSSHGLRFLDAPVSGGDARARAGELTVMVGGDESVLNSIRQVLESLSSNIVHLGPVGAGSATKLANQLMLFANLNAAMEALDLAKAYGVSEQAVMQAIGTSLGESWVTRNWGFFDEAKAAYDLSHTRLEDRPWSKDLWEILVAGRSAGVSLPHAALLAQSLPGRVESRGDSDSAG